MFDLGWMQKKEIAYLGIVSPGASSLIVVSGLMLQIGHDWTIDFLVKKQHDFYILIVIIKPLRRAHVN